MAIHPVVVGAAAAKLLSCDFSSIRAGVAMYGYSGTGKFEYSSARYPCVDRSLFICRASQKIDNVDRSHVYAN